MGTSGEDPLYYFTKLEELCLLFLSSLPSPAAQTFSWHEHTRDMHNKYTILAQTKTDLTEKWRNGSRLPQSFCELNMEKKKKKELK